MRLRRSELPGWPGWKQACIGDQKELESRWKPARTIEPQMSSSERAGHISRHKRAIRHLLAWSRDAPEQYDVAVIGAGVVGCAIAMELSKYSLRTILLEARSDIGAGTSKANSAILHTGFDATPGSLESRLVRRGLSAIS